MDPPADHVTPALERLAPALTAIFAAYGVPAARQEEILREAARLVTVVADYLRRAAHEPDLRFQAPEKR